MEIALEVFAGVLAARIVGDALAAALIVYRSKKRKRQALSQLKQWQDLLSEQEQQIASASAVRDTAEITD